MSVRLHDTMTKEVKPLEASDGGRFRFYCCGPTVYGPAHIGNFRTFVIQDVLRRVLELDGYKPLHVRNLTDVDDKTIRGSMAAGQSLGEFTGRWTEKFHGDCEALNLLEPHVEPAATEHIEQQIGMIESLIEKGHAYVGGDGSVYYKVSSFEEYGKLAHICCEDLRTQAENSAGEVNCADEYDRESVQDFALWKAWKEEDGPNAWQSPWGKGRPGWHIECSAMSREYLGDTFDLHGGGVDLTFPHHENEIAQSEGATGKPFALHWFHSAHLMVEGEKMSKSLGNLYTLDDLVQKGYTPVVVRYLLISGHFRHSLNFTFDGLGAARSALGKLEKLAGYLLEKAGKVEGDWGEYAGLNFEAGWGRFERAWEVLCDDLNVPGALGEVFSAAKALEGESAVDALQELEGLGKILYALGLELFTEEKVEAPAEVVALAQARWEAKAARDFGEADRLRGEIESAGWKVLDGKDGFELEQDL